MKKPNIEKLFRESIEGQETNWDEHGHTEIVATRVDAEGTTHIDTERTQISFLRNKNSELHESSFGVKFPVRTDLKKIIVSLVLWLAGGIFLVLAFKNFFGP